MKDKSSGCTSSFKEALFGEDTGLLALTDLELGPNGFCNNRVFESVDIYITDTVELITQQPDLMDIVRRRLCK